MKSNRYVIIYLLEMNSKNYILKLILIMLRLLRLIRLSQVSLSVLFFMLDLQIK